jgi:hypothetical protein
LRVIGKIFSRCGFVAGIWLRWRLSEADQLPDEDDMDAAGQLLVDLEDPSDGAVLPVAAYAPASSKFQAVLVDPIVRRFYGHELLCA